MIRIAAEYDFREMLTLYGHLVPADETALDHAMLRDCWRELVSQPGVSVIVHSYNARLVSTCTLIMVPNIMRAGRPYAYIENFVTHPDHRRKGFGQATLRRAIQMARDKDCYKILLVASSKNDAAAALYQSVGFSPNRTGFQIRDP